jgi:ribosomal protein S16
MKKGWLEQYAQGGMIKRADGSYSQRGLWDNIRANAGSGKKPTKEMLRQEKKIRAAEKAQDGKSISFEEYYKHVPQYKNDTSGYDLKSLYLNDPKTAWEFANSPTGHAPDTYKKPNHITFSSESMYATPSNPGGKWAFENNQDVFYATPQNVKNAGGKEQLQNYFKTQEKGVKLVLPKKQKGGTVGNYWEELSKAKYGQNMPNMTDEQIAMVRNTNREMDDPLMIPSSPKVKAQKGAKISTQGYKKNSPDKNEPMLIIPSNRITMQDVEHSVMAYPSTGNPTLMHPNSEYYFPYANYVTEVPVAQDGNYIDGVYNPNAKTIKQLASASTQQQVQNYNKQKQVEEIQQKQDLSTLKEAQPRRGKWEKAGAIARNPFTAFSYSVQGQPIPDYFEKGERTSFDNAVDIVNPLGYYDAAKNILTAKHFKNAKNTTDYLAAIPLTLLDATQFTGLGSEEKLVAAGLEKQLEKEAEKLAIESKKVAPNVINKEATKQHFPSHNTNNYLPDNFNPADLQHEKSYVGVTNNQKVKVLKPSKKEARIDLYDIDKPNAYFNMSVENLHQKYPKVTDINLFGEDPRAASNQIATVLDAFPRIKLPADASLSNYSAAILNKKLAALAKDKNRINIKLTGEKVPDNYIYKSAHSDLEGRVKEFKEMFPILDQSYGPLTKRTGVGFPKREIRVSPPGTPANKVSYSNSVPISLEEVTPENIQRTRSFRPVYEATKNYMLGGAVNKAQQGWSSSDLNKLKEVQSNWQPSPYPDMDPAMLQQYRDMQHTMELSTTPKGRVQLQKEKLDKTQRKKKYREIEESKQASEDLKKQSAIDRSQMDPSIFSSDFYKTNEYGRGVRDRLYDLGVRMDEANPLRTGKGDFIADKVAEFNPGVFFPKIAFDYMKAPKEAKEQNSYMPYVGPTTNLALALLTEGAGKYFKGVEKLSVPANAAEEVSRVANLGLDNIRNLNEARRIFHSPNPERILTAEESHLLDAYGPGDSSHYTDQFEPVVTNQPAGQTSSNFNQVQNVIMSIEDDLRARGHRSPADAASSYVHDNIGIDENGNYMPEELLDSYTSNNHAEQILSQQPPLTRYGLTQDIYQNIRSHGGIRNSYSVAEQYVDEMLDNRGMTPQQAMDHFTNNDVINHIYNNQKPEFIDLTSDHGKTIKELDFDKAEKYRYKAANNAGNVEIEKYGTADNNYYNITVEDPTSTRDIGKRKELHFIARHDKYDPEFPEIDNISFFNDSPISAGKQLDEAFRIVGPKAKMETRGSTSIYSTPLWYNRVAKFIKDADPKLDAKTPFGKRVTIDNVRELPMNSIVKHGLKDINNKKISSYTQSVEQIPHIQKSIQKLSQLSGTDLPPLKIKYKNNPISVEEYMKLGDQNLNYSDIWDDTEITVPDFSFKKYYKQGGKLTKNWLQNY